MQSSFDILKGWSSRFEVDGVSVGGPIELYNDHRLLWHLKTIGGVQGKTVLELGALEGAHTRTMEEAGAIVTAIEGNANNFLKCLVVKNEFNLKAKFIYADFCEYVKVCRKFDIVSAAGVLYHQTNPADLIFDLAKITDTVLVWSQVASENNPPGKECTIMSNNCLYYGKVNDYGNTRSDSFCGGLNKSAFWMYGYAMRECFHDAGFMKVISKDSPPNNHGETLLFVAKK